MTVIELILQKISARHDDLQRRMVAGKTNGMCQLEEFGLLSEDVATMEIYNMICKEIGLSDSVTSEYAQWLKTA